MRRILPVVLLAAAGAGAAGAAWAGSETHYQDLVVGERAAGMGGAFTALGDEATGAYYNPAGIVVERSTLLQLSMSAYKLRRRQVETADICGTTLHSDESAFFGFPGSFGFVHQLGNGKVRHALGLTLVVPHLDKTSQSLFNDSARCGATSASIGGSELHVDRALWAGLSYAIKPWRFLQLGATVGLSVRSATLSLLLVTLPSDGATRFVPGVTFLDGETTIWSLFFQLGVVVEPIAGLRFGLSLTTPYVRLAGGGRLDYIGSVSDPARWGSTGGLVLDDAEYYWNIPLKVALGAAYTRRWLTVAADVTFHAPVDRYAVYSHPALPEAAALHNQRDLVVNVNLGGEARLGARWALRLGFFTNLSSASEAPGNSFERMHLFGLTTGATFHASERSTFSATVQTQLGRGQTSAYRVSTVDGTIVESSYWVDARDFALVVGIGGSFDIR